MTAPDRLSAQIDARVRHLLDTCPACAQRAAWRESAPRLSPRRREMLTMVADGLTRAQIAERLWVTEATVKATLAAARRALGARSNTHAVAIALRAGVID